MGRRRASGGNAPLNAPLPPQWAEQLTADRLEESGWRVLARNYRLRGGELDLVCQDEDGVIVFVEVKQRRSDAYGGAGAAIDARKLRRLRRTAAHYLAYELKSSEAAARFDAVLISGSAAKHSFEHLRDAW